MSKYLITNINDFKSYQMVKEHLSLRELTKSEIDIVEKFLEFLDVMFSFEKIESISKLGELKKAIEPFSGEAYFKEALEQINRAEKNINKHTESQTDNIEKSNFIAAMTEVFNRLNHSDFTGAVQLNKKWSGFIEKTQFANKSMKDAIDYKNPYNKGERCFLHSEDFVPFTKGNLDYLKDVFDNISEYKIFYPFPSEHSFENMLLFLNELTKSDTTKLDYKKYIQIKYSHDETYKKLMKIAKEYLHNNNKSLIPKMLELLNSMEELKKINDDSKKTITTVYRGIGFQDEEDSDKETVIKNEQSKKYVAASDNRKVALNFAYMRGHLDSGRNSIVGYVITYNTTPDSILINFPVVFGSVFGEGEILIDATLATIENIKTI